MEVRKVRENERERTGGTINLQPLIQFLSEKKCPYHSACSLKGT